LKANRQNLRQYHTGAAILVSRGTTLLQATQAGELVILV
jgi:hypothetical protein